MYLRLATAILVLSMVVNLAGMIRVADWWIPVGLLVGWVVADFGSGLVHMLLDYVRCPPETGLDLLYFHRGHKNEAYAAMKRDVMKRADTFHRLAFEFKFHHPWPEALGRRSFTNLCRDTLMFGALPISLVLTLAVLTLPLPAGVIAAGSALTVAGVFVQWFHGELHRPTPHPVVALMRRLRLLMSPSEHQIHHDTLDRDFAIITGWTNPILNPLFQVLRRLGLVQDENLEPMRSDATRDVVSPDPRPGLAKARA